MQALEAAVASLVRPGMHVLNLVSGVFGAGMGEWLARLGAQVHTLRVPYNEVVSPDSVAGYLDAHPGIELLAVVHSETPSGTLHDLAGICGAAAARGVLTMADCVSSVGGMPVETDAWGLDVCVTGPQKCLAGPPGLAMVSVSSAAWAMIDRNPGAPRSSSLSLLDWRDLWHGKGRFPYTPSVNLVCAVDAACAAVLAEGLPAAFARTELAARACRASGPWGCVSFRPAMLSRLRASPRSRCRTASATRRYAATCGRVTASWSAAARARATTSASATWESPPAASSR